MWATIAVQTSRLSKLCDGERDQITPFCSLNYKFRTRSHDVVVKGYNSSVAGKKYISMPKQPYYSKTFCRSSGQITDPALNGYRGGIFSLTWL
jgi:hypothetical protein